MRALFTEKTIQKIEKDIGCKLRLEEKFLIVSGKDRLILAKGADAVHKMIKDGGDRTGPSGSYTSRPRSPVHCTVGDRFRRSDSQRSNRGPPRESQFQPRFNKQERVIEDRIHEDFQRFTKFSPPQGRAIMKHMYMAEAGIFIRIAFRPINSSIVVYTLPTL